MKVKILKSLRLRLTLWYALSLGLIFLASDIILYRGFKLSLLDNIDNTLIAAAEEVERSLSTIPLDKWKTMVKQIERGFLVNRLFIQILEIPSGKEGNFNLVARSGVLSGNISQREIWERLSHQLPPQPVYLEITDQTPSIHPFRMILYPVKESGDRGYLIQVGTSLKKMFNTLKNFLIILLVSGPMLLLVSILGGYFILTRALQPVKSVVQAARKITTEDLSHRIQSQNRKDEIGLLITTFNDMIARLEHSVAQIKQFSSDASHDLKTPLTIIRGEIDITLRKKRTPRAYIETLDTIREESKKLEWVIDNLLFLSRIDNRNHQRFFQRIDLDEILLEVFESTQPLAAKKKIAYVLNKVEAIPVNGDPILLNRLMMNLVDNAIKYTTEGGQVEMSLERTDGSAYLTVKDTGMGIPAESLPYIFDRFYRVDQSRTQRSQGSGLGLAIVKKIADIHRAKITLTSQPQQGTTVHLCFASGGPPFY